MFHRYLLTFPNMREDGAGVERGGDERLADKKSSYVNHNYLAKPFYFTDMLYIKLE